MQPAQLFDRLAARIAERPQLVEEIGAVYRFDVEGEEGGSWVIDLKTPPGSVRRGTGEEADCVVAVSQSDLAGIVSGQVDPQSAFLMGRIRVAGNFMLATKLRALLG